MSRPHSEVMPPHTITGVRARKGPYTHLTLELPPGLTALYGLNGAGKSWALRTVIECGTGLVGAAKRSDYSQLFVEAPAGSTLYRYLVTAAGQGEDAAWAEFSGEPRGRATPKSPAEAVEAFFLDRRAPYLPRGYDADHAEAVPYDYANYLNEVSSSTIFAFVPTGIRRPEWEVWICAAPYDAAGPAVREAIDAVRTVRDRVVRDVDTYLAAQEASWEENPTGDDESLGDDPAWSADAAACHPLYGWTWHHVPVGGFDEPVDLGNSDLHDFFHDGLPIPAARLCVLRGAGPVDVFDESDQASLQELTAAELRYALERARWEEEQAEKEEEGEEEEEAEEGPATHSAESRLLAALAERHFLRELAEPKLIDLEKIALWRDQVEERANDTYARLLEDAPHLTLTIRAPFEWLTQDAAVWTVEGVPVAELSRAESRWAAFAIRWALGSPPDLVVLDEPEAALHRAAEEHVVTGLDGLTITGTRFLVATHSPFALDAPQAHLYEVRREPNDLRTNRRGSAHARPLPGVARSDLSRLGLRPSDLLRRARVFVLVEGEHDRIIIEQVCREQLDEARAHVVPMRGAGQLPITVDSQVLFDFTDAHVVAVLDNVDLAAVETAWSGAQQLAQLGSVDQAVEFVRTHLRGGPQEYDWLRSWLTRALRTGRHSRLTPLGLGRVSRVLGARCVMVGVCRVRLC